MLLLTASITIRGHNNLYYYAAKPTLALVSEGIHFKPHIHIAVNNNNLPPAVLQFKPHIHITVNNNNLSSANSTAAQAPTPTPAQSNSTAAQAPTPTPAPTPLNQSTTPTPTPAQSNSTAAQAPASTPTPAQSNSTAAQAPVQKLSIAAAPINRTAPVPTLTTINHLIDKGNALNKQGKDTGSNDYYEQAISLFDKVLAIDPNDKNALNGKGEALSGEGNYVQAISLFDKVLAIDPNDKNALNGKCPFSCSNATGAANMTQSVVPTK